MGYEIDFLPVGNAGKSGDAITLRYGDLFGTRDNQRVVVVDGGFSANGSNIVEHVKTYYKTDRVDFVISTHPDADHAAGLETVLREMKVGCLLMHRPWEHADDIARMFRDGRVTDISVKESLRKSLDNARALETLAKQKGIPLAEPFAGLQLDSGTLRFVGPSQAFYESLLPHFRGTPEPTSAHPLLSALLGAGGAVLTKVAEAWHIETLSDDGETTAENNSSAVLVLTIDGRSSLLTSDAGIPALELATLRLELEGFTPQALGFVQVPHHGSARNVGPSILDRLLGPRRAEGTAARIAFLSAAADAAPKHPSKKVTNAFLRRGSPVHGTMGMTKRHSENAPPRSGWITSVPLSLYSEVED